MSIETENLYGTDKADPKIIIICDIPSERSYMEGKVMPEGEVELVAKELRRNGFEPSDAAFVIPCPPIPDEASGSVKRTNEFMDQYREEFFELLQKFAKPDAVVVLGANAGRQITRKAMKITKARGIVSSHKGIPMLPVFSPRMVRRRPELKDIFESDFRLLGTLREADWDTDVFEHEIREGDYTWETDIGFLLEDRPKQLVVDVETVGLRWMGGAEACPLVTVQLCWGEGKACSIPIMESYVRDRRQDLIDAIEDEESREDPNEERLSELRSLLSQAPPEVSQEDIDSVLEQLRELLADPGVMVVGHNLKFDIHCLRNYDVEVANWWGDTMQLAFTVDDNMESKSLDDCVQRWVPAMAGYANAFNSSTDKSRMDLVPLDKMLHYGCGDVDATYRLCKVLVREAMQDARNWNCYVKVQMPGLRTFVDIEENGFHVDRDALRALSAVLVDEERRIYRELLRATPDAVKRRHLGDPKMRGKPAKEILKFSRDVFTADILFSPDGFALEPVMFTPGTRNLRPYFDSELGHQVDPRIPSVSQDHLSYFEGHDFVTLLIEWKKLTKMQSTYVGNEAQVEFENVKPIANGKKWPKKVYDCYGDGTTDPPTVPELATSTGRRVRLRKRTVVEQAEIVRTYAYTRSKDLCELSDGRLVLRETTQPKGFWQYLSDGRNDLHPSFWLHRTVTGRSASSDPNGQNIPKRGDLAKAFRKVFCPRPGWKLLSADYSQVELRLAAWMAKEDTMLEIYNSGGDIHCATGANAIGVEVGEFMTWKESDEPYDRSRFGNFPGVDLHTMNDFYEMLRHRAKGFNFGLIYGQWWTGLQVYMKTGYQTTLTDQEAKDARERFFSKFGALEGWHWDMKKFADSKGYVRSLHGALRRLPSVHSDDEGVQGEARRQAINSPIQRFASDLGVMAMARFNRDAPRDRFQICGFIHDDIICQFDPEKIDVRDAASYLKFYMETNPLQKWFGIVPPIPIQSDPAGPGDNLAEMADLHNIQAVRPDWYQEQLDL